MNENNAFVILTVVSRSPELERDVVVQFSTFPGSAVDNPSNSKH